MTDDSTTSTIAARLGLDLHRCSVRYRSAAARGRVEDGYSLIRTGDGPRAKVVVIHDGSDLGIAEARGCARLLVLAPTMLALLVEALSAWEREFDGSGEADECVPGSDMVEWFASWRREVRATLAALAAAPRTAKADSWPPRVLFRSAG